MMQNDAHSTSIIKAVAKREFCPHRMSIVVHELVSAHSNRSVSMHGDALRLKTNPLPRFERKTRVFWEVMISTNEIRNCPIASISEWHIRGLSWLEEHGVDVIGVKSVDHRFALLKVVALRPIDLADLYDRIAPILQRLYNLGLLDLPTPASAFSWLKR